MYGRLGYKIFIVNVVSMQKSAALQFWPFQRSWTSTSWLGGLMNWATVEGVSSEVEGGQKCEDKSALIAKKVCSNMTKFMQI